MEWKKLWEKTFEGPFFHSQPVWVKALWAVMIAKANDEGVLALCTVCTELKQGKGKPSATTGLRVGQASATTGLRVGQASATTGLRVVQAMAKSGMVEMMQKNGASYFRLLNWDKYQPRNSICSSERKKDREKERFFSAGAEKPQKNSSPSLSPEEILDLRRRGKYVTKKEIDRANEKTDDERFLASLKHQRAEAEDVRRRSTERNGNGVD